MFVRKLVVLASSVQAGWDWIRAGAPTLRVPRVGGMTEVVVVVMAPPPVVVVAGRSQPSDDGTPKRLVASPAERVAFPKRLFST